MVRRLAGCLALLTFAVCIAAVLNAVNTAATILSNALAAMGVTFVVGLAVGAMAQKMLDENVAAAAARKAEPATAKENLENPERIPEPRGR
jgi:hypothetical protein